MDEVFEFLRWDELDDTPLTEEQLAEMYDEQGWSLL